MDRRTQSLDDLVCLTYDDRSLDPSAMTDIEIGNELRAWLATQQAR